MAAKANTLTLSSTTVDGELQETEAQAHGHSDPNLHHHFDDMGQQREAHTLAMWAFLATEIMMFGGLFFAYTLYRWSYGEAFAIGSHHMNWQLGSINTGVLLVSSLTMALAVHAAATRDRKKLLGFLAITFVLGVAFLVIKGFEWKHDYDLGLFPGVMWNYYDRPENFQELTRLATLGITPENIKMFFVVYFCMSGLHAIHMLIGLGMLGIFMYRGNKGHFTNGNDQPIELGGLYWHLIDIIWVFLFPLLYLVGGLHPIAG